MLTAAWEDETKARREQRPARRYYRLTPKGQVTADEALARFPALGRIFADGNPKLA